MPGKFFSHWVLVPAVTARLWVGTDPEELEVPVLIPEPLTQRGYADWNYLVRGLVCLWDRASAHGGEAELERLLESDDTGAMAELLGRLGNDWHVLRSFLQQEISNTPRSTALPVLVDRMFLLSPFEVGRKMNALQSATANPESQSE